MRKNMEEDGGISSPSAFCLWSESLRTTASHLSIADKLQLWQMKVHQQSKDHTDPRNKGKGKHGESSYTWEKSKSKTSPPLQSAAD